MEYEELWPNGPRIALSAGHAPGTDSMLLYDFAGSIKAGRIIDLGCGTGLLTVLLAYANPDAEVTGIEILPDIADCCRSSIALNGLQNAGVVTGDLREHRRLFEAGAYDLVVSNPPYFPESSGKASPDAPRAASRDERSCTLMDVCRAAKYLCRFGGAFALVHRPERLSEAFCAMTASGIEPKRLRPVQHRQGEAPNLVLIEGRRGGGPGLKIEAALVLTENGRDSDEVMNICHRGAYA